MPVPDLPAPAHPEVDSMLSRKFGREIANYFAGSPLNRLGFLRGDHTFLSQALKHQTTGFLLCNELQPLIKKDDQGKVGGRLAWVKYEDVKPVIGEDPYANDEKKMVEIFNSEKITPQMIFLGIDEKAKDGLSYMGKNRYTGRPFFAVDVTPKGSVKEACEGLIKKLDGEGFEFAKGRVMELEAGDGEYRRLPGRSAGRTYC